MENNVYIIVDSTGWISPFYFTSYISAAERLFKVSTHRGKPCKIEKLQKSCFDEY